MPKVEKPKYSALQDLLMTKKGIKLSIVDGEWVISDEVNVRLPTRTRPINVYVHANPGGQAGRGGGKNYNLQHELRMIDSDYKMARSDAKTVAMSISAIDCEKAYGFQSEGAIDLFVKKFVALYPEFQPFCVYGYWAVRDFLKLVLRVKSGQANTRAREALKPVDDTVKPRKKRGRPRKSALARELLAAGQPPVENLPVPLVPAAPDGQPPVQDPPAPVQPQPVLIPPQPVVAPAQLALRAPERQSVPSVAASALDDGVEEFDFGGLDDDSSMLSELGPSAMDLDIEKSIIEPMAQAKLTDEDDNDDGQFNLAQELGEPLVLTPSHASTPAPTRRITPVATTRVAAAHGTHIPVPPGQPPACAASSAAIADPVPAFVATVAVPVPVAIASGPAAAAPAALAPVVAAPNSTNLASQSSATASAPATVSPKVVDSLPVGKVVAPFASTTSAAVLGTSIVCHGLTLKLSEVEKYRMLGIHQAKGNSVRCGPLYRSLVDRFAEDPTYDPSSEPLAPGCSPDDPLVSAPARGRGRGRGASRGSTRTRARAPAPEDCMVSDVDADVDLTRTAIPEPSPKKPEPVARPKPRMRPVPTPDANTESVAGNRVLAPPVYIATSSAATAPADTFNEQGAASEPYSATNGPPVVERADNPVGENTEEGVGAATGSALGTTGGAMNATSKKGKGKATNDAISEASTSTAGAKKGTKSRASAKAPAQPVRRSGRKKDA